MAYGNHIPIRESLLERVPSLIEKHKGKLVVVEYDIQLQTWTVRQQTINAWALIVETLGALVGDEHHLTYVWTFGSDPRPPSDTVLRDGIRECFRRLGIMQVRQLQTQQSPNNN